MGRFMRSNISQKQSAEVYKALEREQGYP